MASTEVKQPQYVSDVANIRFFRGIAMLIVENLGKIKEYFISMLVNKVSTEDIKNIGSYGKLIATLPDYAACEVAKNLVTRAKVRHPREDGLTYTCSINKKTNTITIETLRPEDVKRSKKRTIK